MDEGIGRAVTRLERKNARKTKRANQHKVGSHAITIFPATNTLPRCFDYRALIISFERASRARAHVVTCITM
jgi:hypothetical protein